MISFPCRSIKPVKSRATAGVKLMHKKHAVATTSSMRIASRAPTRLVCRGGFATSMEPPCPRCPAFLFAAAMLCAGGVTIGCTGVDGGAMPRIFESWRGAPVEQVQAQWGPAAVRAEHAGRHCLYMERRTADGAPTRSGPRDAQLEPPATTARCQRKLLAGANGKVTGGEWSGNACCVQTLVGQCAGLPRKSASGS